MMLRNALPRWLRATLQDELVSERMLSASRFRAALERERMRADRRQGSFTLVEFSAAVADKQLREHIVRLLEARLRATDEFGEMANGIGALLPETDATGAQQLAEYVAGSLPSAQLKWTIHHYPTCQDGNGSEPVLFPSLDSTCEPTSVPLAPAAPLFIKGIPPWKRAIDIVAAAAGLLLLSPVLLIAAIAIKATSPGPILFLQKRTGLGGKPFTIYKLRTMQVDAENLKQQLRTLSEQDGPAFKLKNDPRITVVGKYLRKTCVDELPQLWNVLCGDMTLVGPRPLPCDESAACQNWELRRLDVTPGLTCIWQVRSGRSRIPFAEWMRMDLRYIRARSFVQDVKLLWKTFLAVVLHRASH